MKNKSTPYILIFIFMLAIFASGMLSSNKSTAETDEVRSEEKHSDSSDVLIALLDPYASKEINKKYPNRSHALWNAKILEIKRLSGRYSQYDFIVKVKYDTYTGPFNPPEGPVTITFNVTTSGVSVTEFRE
ncbi:DUF3888 domain-containing protein [Viridibacillus sp. NPDC093762]|uniref:DUF3888 domain-containing protein n=1 Tax=Viridibacillus sp. NPDC093762 TaxID=3390720 RepID=UPI003D031BA9